MSVSPEQILVIIPALNEEDALPGVIHDLQSFGLQHIRVVDNGSTDGTADIARNAGAEVITEKRRGYGQACWTGSQKLPDGIKWLLYCDADGSDDLSVLPEMLAAAADVPFVLADRRSSAESRSRLTPVQNFGNGLASTLIRVGWGARFHDLGPLRLISREAYQQIGMQDRGFGWTVEMQARIAELKIPFREIPMNYRPRQGGTSKISGSLKGSIQAGSVILSTLASLFLDKTVARLALTLLAGFFVLWGSVCMLPHGEFHIAGTVPNFLVGAAIASFGFILCWGIRSLNVWWFWGVAVGARLLLLPMYPGDDIWRYLWEGMIQWHGYSPYLTPPGSAELQPLRTEYWSLINHPNVTAIYPPLTQLLFRIFAGISESVLLFKSVFMLADLAVCWLLLRRFGTVATLLYAWNPLVIYNFAGGGHYDSLFILPLIAAWLLVDRRDAADRFEPWLLACLLLGISVGVKLVSLPLLAFTGIQIWKHFGLRHAAISGICALLPLLFGCAILFYGIPLHIPGSDSGNFVMTARSAEFIPGIIEKIWPDSHRMNQLFTVPLALGCLVLIAKGRSWVKVAEWFFFLLLILSPAVHAWYFTWLIPFAVASRNLGIRLVSITGFAYFILQERTATWTGEGNPWQLTPFESGFLWLPFIMGFLYWICIRRNERAHL
ncbi:MAG: glycosyltransferase family 2 protein [Verrucomicrobiota bacterium]